MCSDCRAFGRVCAVIVDEDEVVHLQAEYDCLMIFKFQA